MPSKYYETEIQDMTNSKGAKLSIKSMLTGTHVYFAAFLTSFSQSFTSTWNEEEVYGRMDPIATFQNTRRSISVAFDVPAANIRAAKENLRKCDNLAKFLYPGYNKITEIGKEKEEAKAETNPDGTLTKAERNAERVISKPPLVGVKFANLIGGGANSQLGYITGLEWTPSLEMGMFSSDNKFYPKVISLSFTLNVLHQADKGWQGKTWISDPFFKA